MRITFVEEEPMHGRERVVETGDVVGRGGADVELADPEVSRRHAVFRAVDDRPAVEDLGSRNGTFVNEQQVAGVIALSAGDRLRFGHTVWRLGADGVPRKVGTSARAEDDRPPTALRQAIPSEPVIGEAPEFRLQPRPGVFGRSAARRVEATVFSYGVILAAAAGVAFFFAQR